jgi:hypothetical protein
MGDCKKLHNEELHSLYLSPFIVRVMRSWRIRCGNVAKIGEMRKAWCIGMQGRHKKWVQNFGWEA